MLDLRAENCYVFMFLLVYVALLGIAIYTLPAYVLVAYYV